MSKTLTGDFNSLEQLAAELNQLSNSFSQFNQQAAKDLESKAKSQFASARGPDDKPWKPRQDGQKALQSLVNDVRFFATQNGITESVPEVAKYHQDSRPMIPESQNLPAPWNQTLINSYDNSIKGIIKPKP